MKRMNGVRVKYRFNSLLFDIFPESFEHYIFERFRFIMMKYYRD